MIEEESQSDNLDAKLLSPDTVESSPKKTAADEADEWLKEKELLESMDRFFVENI